MPKASDAQVDAMFGDIDFRGTEVQESAPVTVQKPSAQPSAIHNTIPVSTVPPLKESAGAVQAQTQQEPSSAPQEGVTYAVQPTAPVQLPPSTPVEEVEIDEGEYQHFMDIAKNTPDQLIAKYVSQRKASSTLQSQRDKLTNAVGKQFAEAVNRGEVTPEMQRLFTDLFHPEMQSHLAEFYQDHELKDGKYVRVRAKVPPADVLKKFLELSTEKASLSAVNFMPKDEDSDFDANEALTQPQSPSGRAYASYIRRASEIDSEINSIINQSVSEPTTTAAATIEQQREAGRRALETLSTAHADLQNPATMAEFNQYVSVNANNLLEVLYKAFRSDSVSKSSVRKLVVRELEAINANREGALQQPGVQAASSGEAVPDFLKNVDPKLRDLVKKDADYFGDYHR